MAQSILQICKLSSKTIQNQGISICKTHSNPQQRKPAEGKAHPSPATTTCKRKGTPIPSNDNLQKERHVKQTLVVTLLQPNGERCDEDRLNH
ncbi:hypothetical protein DAPPUDRAFT_233464 [Daphnia pulex]|uniref:Uncharacterized protein n=1 Tax=Daphnia pulex TaxID=6669 RepID=E9FU45_DAPPU|nr:hypothetical protein DAPPUDRAFT_233464 [Daphnia pulex]|eukprot:EFX89484.1 hypothetical protein DAPPUDRAFT_233464 [Daphnia pulex]